MKVLSAFFMIVAAVSLILGVIWRIAQANFPLGDTPPQSFLEFAGVCLLFALTLGVSQIAKKSP